MFVIADAKTFIQKVMPRYFKHQNFQSVVRLLNMYGFKKVPFASGQHAYENPDFHQHVTQRPKISRKKSKNESRRKINASLTEEQPNCFNHSPYSQAVVEQEYLQGVLRNSMLMAENAKNWSAIESEARATSKRLEKIVVGIYMASNMCIPLPQRWDKKLN